MEEKMEEYKEVEVTEEIKDEDDSCRKESGLSTEGLIGAAILGAVGSMVLYYIYCNLNEETKITIKDQIIKFAKKQLAGLK